MDFAKLIRGDEVIIVGTSGFAVELAGLLRDVGIDVRGCIGPEVPPKAADLEHIGGDECIACRIGVPFLVAIGKPKLRSRLFGRIVQTGGRIAGFVHPASYLSSRASVGEGVIVYPNATVHAGVTLGRGALVNSNSTIGHETSVGAFVNIGPGASLGGRARIGDGVILGIGASIIEGITVAADAVLGAGATVVRNCDTAGTYVGVPARLKVS